MPIATRDLGGRASSHYLNHELYGVVREVAFYVSPAMPTRVRQRAFDRSRAEAGHPDAPTARVICSRLRGSNGQPISWRDLLEIVFSEDHPDFTRREALRGGSAEAPHLDVRHLTFALRFVAKELEKNTLTPMEYEAGRERLIRREARRLRGAVIGPLLPELLPTVGQIERIAGGNSKWDEALRLAELQPRSSRKRKRPRRSERQVRETISTAEAIHHFIEANGYLPSKVRLAKFVEMLNIAAEYPKHRRWADQLDEARQFRTELGLETPAGSPPHGWSAPKTIELPADGLPDVPRRTPHKGITREEVLEELRKFDRLLPSGVPRTQKRYIRVAVEHELIAASNIARFGRWQDLMAEARAGRSNGSTEPADDPEADA